MLLAHWAKGVALAHQIAQEVAICLTEAGMWRKRKVPDIFISWAMPDKLLARKLSLA
jgi:hypothetical protein